jgi:hypothetical protein
LENENYSDESLSDDEREDEYEQGYDQGSHDRNFGLEYQTNLYSDATDAYKNGYDDGFNDI